MPPKTGLTCTECDGSVTINEHTNELGCSCTFTRIPGEWEHAFNDRVIDLSGMKVPGLEDKSADDIEQVLEEIQL